MTVTLSFDLKNIMSHLAKDDRWNVLTTLMLHTNIRNRCYPSMRSIATFATNGNLHRATAAKKWLEKHEAFELVPYGKRVDDEKLCGKRQHIYQLTGVLKGCDDPECGCWQKGSYTYLYFGKPTPDDIVDGNNIKAADIAITEIISGDNRSITREEKKDSDTNVSVRAEKKPKRECLPKEIQQAIGECVMEWQPLNGWHWKQLNSKKLAENLLPHNITLEEIQAFRRWYTWKFPNAPYTHPNIIAGKIDLMRADIRTGKFRLVKSPVHIARVSPAANSAPDPEAQRRMAQRIGALASQLRGGKA